MVEKASTSIRGAGPEKLAAVSVKIDPGENGCDIVSGCIGESRIPIVSESNSAELDDDLSTTGALPFDSVEVLGGDFGKCSFSELIDVTADRERREWVCLCVNVREMVRWVREMSK
jgi:hypothetical protein